MDAGVYGNRFDIMSAMNVFSFNDAAGRVTGPGASAINLENLGWLHRSRVWRSWPATPRTVELSAINRPDVPGFLAARLQLAPTFPAYYLEYRQATAWDAGLPGPRVLVNVRNNESGPQIFGGGWDPTGSLGSGEDLLIPGSFPPTVVRVEAVDTATSRARVRMWTLPANASRAIRIVSLVWDPPGTDWKSENVVVRNDTSAIAALGGWSLSDYARRHTFTFPAGFTLDPGHDVKIWTRPGTNTATDLFLGRSSAIWNNTGDTATLTNASGGIVSTYSYLDGGH